MISCKHCGNKNIVKRGLVKDKQRYLCKACNKSFCIGDEREKSSRNKKIKIAKLYSEKMEPRPIEKIGNASESIFSRGIQNVAKTIKNLFERSKKT